MGHHNQVLTEYLHNIYKDPIIFRAVVRTMVEKIRVLKKRTRIDAIAFSGTSGAAVGYPLGYSLGIPLLCVRKQGDKTHSPYTTVEGNFRSRDGRSGRKTMNYIIVDDFVASGATIARIRRLVDHEAKMLDVEAKMLCVFCYDSSDNRFGMGKETFTIVGCRPPEKK